MAPKSADTNKQKQVLRKEALTKRAIFQSAHPKVDSELCEKLTAGLRSLRSENGVWVGYRAVRSEANPEAAIQVLGGRWAYPRVSGCDLEFYLTNNQSTWEVGSFGIPEPTPESSQRIDLHSAEGILVPGSAFDGAGNRLGSGHSFYDRALVGFKGHKVGVAYSVQLHEQLPSEAHDIRMDYLATEEKFSAVKG